MATNVPNNVDSINNTSDAIIAEGGDIALSDAANSNVITYDDSPNNYANYASNVTSEMLGGNDSITNYGSNVLIDGGAGKDTIYNLPIGENVTIYGGEDNDYLYNDGDSNVTIDGGGATTQSLQTRFTIPSAAARAKT